MEMHWWPAVPILLVYKFLTYCSNAGLPEEAIHTQTSTRIILHLGICIHRLIIIDKYLAIWKP